MIPKGGKFANAVVNRVHSSVKDWKKFKEAVNQIEDLLKRGRVKLDGKQKTIFESNRNILKNHEKFLVEPEDSNEIVTKSLSLLNKNNHIFPKFESWVNLTDNFESVLFKYQSEIRN